MNYTHFVYWHNHRMQRVSTDTAYLDYQALY